MTEVICVLDAKAELGECPVWSADEQALYWVDIYAPSMNRLDPATGENRNWIMPDTDRIVRAAGVRWRGGGVGAMGSTCSTSTPARRRFWPRRRRVPGTRFNDGKVSPGRPVFRRHDGRGVVVAADRDAVSA